MNSDLDLRRIPLDNAFNFRSLGGYAGHGGMVTRHGVFYRSGWLNGLSPRDKERIKALGIRTIIDLRSKAETIERPDDFLDDPEITHIHIDVMAALNPEKLGKLFRRDAKNVLSSLYKAMLEESKEEVKRVILSVAQGLDRGGVLFHCMVGKDRTGLTAMLLLSIAGVDVMDILADYEVSETYIDMVQDHMGSKKENMMLTLEHIRAHYGTPAEYLRQIGISNEILDKICGRFLK